MYNPNANSGWSCKNTHLKWACGFLSLNTLFCLHLTFSSVNLEEAMKESLPSSRVEVFSSPSFQLTFLFVADQKWPQVL